MPSDRDPDGGEAGSAQAAGRILVEFARRRARVRWLVGLMILIGLSAVVAWRLTSSVALVSVLGAVTVAVAAIALVSWRCPACGKSPGKVGSLPNFCGACAVPLVEGERRRVDQTPERAEWVVTTVRRRFWLVLGSFVLAFGGGAVAGWLLVRADMRPWAAVVFLLGVFGWTLLVARIWRCPECKAPLGDIELKPFCARCGVTHSRKGLERARARA